MHYEITLHGVTLLPGKKGFTTLGCEVIGHHQITSNMSRFLPKLLMSSTSTYMYTQVNDRLSMTAIYCCWYIKYRYMCSWLVTLANWKMMLSLSSLVHRPSYGKKKIEKGSGVKRVALPCPQRNLIRCSDFCMCMCVK